MGHTRTMKWQKKACELIIRNVKENDDWLWEQGNDEVIHDYYDCLKRVAVEFKKTQEAMLNRYMEDETDSWMEGDPEYGNGKLAKEFQNR